MGEIKALVRPTIERLERESTVRDRTRPGSPRNIQSTDDEILDLIKYISRLIQERCPNCNELLLPGEQEAPVPLRKNV